MRKVLFAILLLVALPSFALTYPYYEPPNGSSSSGGGASNWTDIGANVYTTGNVGIGTSAPISALDIKGIVNIESGATDSLRLGFSGGNNGITMQWTNQGIARGVIGTEYNQSPIYFGATHLVTPEIGIKDETPDAKLEISLDGSTATDGFMVSSDDGNDGDLFIVDGNGNVGIGTTTPSSALDVNGTITITNGTISACSITTDADGTCDAGTKIAEDNSIAICLVCS